MDRFAHAALVDASWARSSGVFPATAIMETLATYGKFHATWLIMVATMIITAETAVLPILINWKA